MVELGKHNRLQVTRRGAGGLFVDGGDDGEILLPRREADAALRPGDTLDLFVYRDSRGRLVATRTRPKARVGECAWLEVVSIGRHGAFLDWGLPKDLLLPRGEQQQAPRVGQFCAAYLFVDPRTRRIVASTRLERHLSRVASGLEARSAVDCLVYGRSDLGFKAVVEHRFLGQFYDNETFRPLAPGQRLTAWIRRVRADGKIDLATQLATRAEHDRLAAAILEHLARHRGESTLTDRSPPEDIYRAFGVSKASYKRALGRLYRQHSIDIGRDRIRLR